MTRRLACLAALAGALAVAPAARAAELRFQVILPGDAAAAAVRADPALDPPAVTATSPLIALVDAQADMTHPEWTGDGNFSSLNTRPLTSLHGTATAAVAAAPVNGIGIVGVWPGARALNLPLPAQI